MLLMPDTPIVEVTVDNFETVVIATSHQRPVLLDISAEWCAPCRFLYPTLEKLALAGQGRWLLATLEAEDENMKIAGRFAVRGFPTVILLHQGVEVARFQGVKPEAFIHQLLQPYLAS